MSNLDYNLPEPTKAQLEYARYLSRFQAPRERRTLFARTESDIAAAFREETANHSWNADDLASLAGIDPRFADALLQRGEAPIEAVFSAADALGPYFSIALKWHPTFSPDYIRSAKANS